MSEFNPRESAPARGFVLPTVRPQLHLPRPTQIAVRLLRGLAVPVGLIFIWYLAVLFGLLSAELLPTPTSVFGGTLLRLFGHSEIYDAIGASLLRVGEGWLIASVIGITLGYAAGLCRSVRLLLEVPVNAGRSLPPAAVVPLAILWLGIGDPAAVALVAFVAVWPVLINTMTGVENVHQVQREAALTLGADVRQLIVTVLVPSALASILVGLRIAMGLAWMAVVLSELVGVRHGLGALLLIMEDNGDVAAMLLIVFVIGVLGLGIDSLFRFLTRPLLRWRKGVLLS